MGQEKKKEGKSEVQKFENFEDNMNHKSYFINPKFNASYKYILPQIHCQNLSY